MSIQRELKEFNSLFTQYQIPFTRFANSYIRNWSIAEDFTMEAFTYYWENKDDLKNNSNVPAYILTIIKNKCLNHLQHLQTQSKVSKELRDTAEWELDMRIATLNACEPNELFSEDVLRILEETLSSLSFQTRNVFVMSRFENKTNKEISEALNITIKGVEFHITKALKSLRSSLKDYYIFYLILLFFAV